MKEAIFADYYETLEISPNATVDTIERVFRYLAQRYHPDNSLSGDAARFSEIVKARDVLLNPEHRARYDLDHEKHLEFGSKLASETEDVADEFEHDAIIQEKILSILHVKRRRDIQNPGLSIMDLERLSGCPREHLDYHLWYIKEKGWMSRLDGGYLVITADGIDRSVMEHRRLNPRKLLDKDKVV
jgi:curved DNA-binding protein CbpA